MVNMLLKIHFFLSDKYSAFLLFVFCLSGLVIAGESWGDQQEMDMEYGEEINETCAGCHGIYGQGSLDGEYPRLAGLEAEYIAKQLSDFKLRKRINIPMIPYANDRELPGDDVRIISEYLSNIQLPTKLAPVDEESFDALERLHASKRVVNIKDYPGDIELGRKVYLDECAICHAKDGYGKKKKKAPQLAGQYSEYLLRQIKHFRSGKRLHDDEKDDAELFSEISDDAFNGMLAYLATLDNK
ncbi:MAG: c-type cytochrome [Gammaproteobacteria bacterium]|nr:MAG: c-type cytochrome [Gammaproteobacteria bacterium]